MTQQAIALALIGIIAALALIGLGVVCNSLFGSPRQRTKTLTYRGLTIENCVVDGVGYGWGIVNPGQCHVRLHVTGVAKCDPNKLDEIIEDLKYPEATNG